VTPEERAALDVRVEKQLMLNPTSAQHLCRQLGLEWGTDDAHELRGSLLRLQKAGKADIVYGRGWHKIAA
jgi:hypothetical protein